MTAAPDLRCMMKIRTCGLFWYKAAVSLSFPTHDAQGPKQGSLEIARPKALGGNLKIPLGHIGRMPTYFVTSEDDRQHCQFTVCYGFLRRCVTVRAATLSIYKAWLTALETAYMTLSLVQMSRAKSTNFDVLSEAEPQQESNNSLEKIGVNDTSHSESRISSSSDRDRSLSSLIGSDVLEYIPSELRDLMDSYASGDSYSTSSSLASSVVDLLPSDLYDLLEDRPTLPVSSKADKQRSSQLSEDCLSPEGIMRHQQSQCSSSGDSYTASTAPLTDATTVSMTLEGVILTAESEEATTNGTAPPPIDSTSTPLQRLLVRQQSRAMKEPRTQVDWHQVQHNEISTIGHRHAGRTEAGSPQNLVIGHVNEARAQEIERFASQRVPSSTRTSKTTLVVEGITEAWTDVARFAFQPGPCHSPSGHTS